jgi:glycosyltransferase involved in cell wall biosynthesis
MTIAVNACFLPHQFPDSDGQYIINCCTALAKQHPQHQFIFITDTAPAVAFPSAKNLSTIVTGPQVKSPLRLQYWLNYKLPAVLRKQQADVLISLGCCSLRTKIKQCLLVDDLSFLQPQNGIAKNWIRYYKNNTGKFLNKAASVIASSEFLKTTLVDTYKINDTKIEVIYKGVNEKFVPFSWQQKDTIKEQYTAGKEFFLYSGIIDTHHNLINLLKAFSFFKKRQKSNMQLVLASTAGITDTAFTKSLSSYKFKEEVKILEHCNIETLAALTAAAYALVYPVWYQGYCTVAVEAMQSGTPVITSKQSSMPEILGDAATYINQDDFNTIADKMMLLFKDEDKKNELIAKGLQQSAAHSRANAVEQIWQTIIKASL